MLSLSWGVWLCINCFHVNLRFLFIFILKIKSKAKKKEKKKRSHLFVLELNDLAQEFENLFYAFFLIQKYM